MKTLVQYVCTMAAIGGVLLAAGCATTESSRGGTPIVSSSQVGPTTEFTVIESSFGRDLSPQEMSQLRDGVTKYLESQGVSPAGEYYVRVNFPPEQPEGTGAWVVVKVNRLPASTYTLIAAYPAIGPDDYYPYAFAYNQGYGFGDFSYGYYDPQIYYPTNYHPRPFPLTPRRHDDGDHRPGDHRKGDKDDHPRGGTPTWHDGPRNHPDGNSPRNYHPDGPRSTPRTDHGGTSSGHRESSPRSSDSGGSRSFSPASSQSSGGSSFSAPSAPVSAPASSSTPAVSSRQNDRTQQN